MATVAKKNSKNHPKPQTPNPTSTPLKKNNAKLNIKANPVPATVAYSPIKRVKKPKPAPYKNKRATLFKIWCIEAGITQRELHEKSGYCMMAIHKMQNDADVKPHKSTIVNMAKLLKLKRPYFLHLVTTWAGTQPAHSSAG